MFAALRRALRYFTQQQAPPGQQGQASQVQTPVSQQPQSPTQQQAPLQQPSAQAGALGAAAEEKSVASKNMNTYIEKSPSRKWQTQIKTETLFDGPPKKASLVAIKSARRSRECGAGEIRDECPSAERTESQAEQQQLQWQ